MKEALIVLTIVIVAALVAVFLRGRHPGPRDLTPDEVKIRDLVREVYSDKIVAEKVTIRAGDAILAVRLNDEKVTSLDINLSCLACKHRDEGLSLPVIKLGLKF